MPSDFTQGAWDIAQLAQWMYDYGILVFLLVFTLIFAVLQKSEILGKGKKNFNIIVALIMGLIVIVPHITGDYPQGLDVVNVVNNALPNVSLVAIAGIMLLLLVGLFGAETRWIGSSLSGWIALAALVFISLIFLNAAGITEITIIDSLDSETTGLIVILLVFALIVWYIVKDDSSANSGKKVGSILNDIGSYFGKK